MVLKARKDRIEIVIPKRDYSSGETVKGQLVLTLNQPKRARALRVELRAEQKGAIASRGIGVAVNTVYKSVFPVKGKGSFSSAKHNFELRLPKSAQEAVKKKAHGAGPVRWYVTASLDVPLAFDITDRKEITVDQKGLFDSSFVSRLKNTFKLQ